MDHIHDVRDWWKGLSWPLAVYRAGLASSFRGSGERLRCAEDRVASRMLTRSYGARTADRSEVDLGRSFARALHPYSWLVAASRMNGTPVFDKTGHPSGHISDVSLDKTSGQAIYVLVAIGGAVGRAELFYPLPWWLLQYDRRKKGYVAPVPLSTLEAGPCLTRDEIEWFGADDSAWRERLEIYYRPYAHPAP
jgi:hypothetical protein